MPQYAVMIWEREQPGGGVELPPEVMQAHGELPQKVAELGGKEVAGLALEATTTATSIRDGLVTDGPFIETKEALLGITVLEARDLDHAIALAKLTPIADGGVEVRPLLDFQVVGAS